LHGDARSIRTYIIDRNINYTNVCNAKCTFCAFRRDAATPTRTCSSKEQIHEKIAELVGDRRHADPDAGRHEPRPAARLLPRPARLDPREVPRDPCPRLQPAGDDRVRHFFDPPGSTLFDKCRWVLTQAPRRGLHSLPGGGGEIFATPVRRKIGLGKCDAEAWLTVMYAAHSLGMFTSATMMFGHIEGYADRVHHMWLVREWQDKALREFARESQIGGRQASRTSGTTRRSSRGLSSGRTRRSGA
jgi:cyclic dehypoxanthinyl futalosine synthase